MSRRKQAEKREVLPDPKYGSVVLSKFINYGMQDGKKTVFEKIVYEALDKLGEQNKKNPIDLFVEAVEKVKPSVEVRSRRVGGATYQVPADVRPARQEALSIRWIISFARKRNERTFAEKLYRELQDIINDQGNSLKKRADTHKMAEANKAFAHFKW
ncbi:MAG: 30S ribosomal protein S7 [Rickettsiales bacterium]|jgi:small subunit ribosomal protein S7|nr:30S ribosomal protein S7 [Rickettsiales bacterium]